MYGGVRGKETKIGRKTFVSLPTRFYMGIETKKSLPCFRIQTFLLNNLLDYSATFVESQQAFAESAQQCFVESAQAFTESLQALAPQHCSTAAFSVWLLAALLPQEAKDTAINATNKNTKFFIFFVF